MSITEHAFYPSLDGNPAVRRVWGSFRPNGATGVVSGSPQGRGWSVARTSAGLYTVTFRKKYPALLSCYGFARTATAIPAIVTGGDYVAASKTLQLRVWQPATAAVTEGGGFIPVPLNSAQAINTNEIPSLSDTEATATYNAGGTLAKNTTPIFERVNGATDKQQRIHWAATVVAEISFPNIPIPPDMAASSDLKVHFAVMKGSNTDSGLTVDVQAFYNAISGVYAADTEMGGNITIADVTTMQELTVTLAAANVGAATPHPGFINLSLVPAAHANDAIYLYGVWLEYTRADWATSGQVWSLTDMAADADNVVNFLAAFQNDKQPTT